MRPDRDPSTGRFKKNGGRDSRANSKRWRERHRETAKQRIKQWSQNNSEYHKLLRKKWRKAHPEAEKKMKNKYRAAHPEKITQDWKKYQAKRYGMTVEQREAAVKSRQSRCDICVLIGDMTPVMLCQDHDKATGQNRGMLCSRHNLGLGHFNHSPNELLAAVEYMKRHSQLQLKAS